MKLEVAITETKKINDAEQLKKIAVTALNNSIKIIISFEQTLKNSHNQHS